MKTQSIPRQLLLLLSLAIGVAALASAALYGTLQQSLRSSSKLTQSALTHLDGNYDLLSKLATLQSAVQSLVRQKDPDAIEAGIKQVESAQQEVLTVIRARGDDAKPVLAAYERLGEQRQLVLNQILTGNGNAAYELFLSAHNPQFEAVLQAAHALQEAVQQQTRAELTTREREIQSGVRWRMAGVALVLLIVFALGWRMKRRIASGLERVVTDLSAVTESLSSNANQISTASQSLAEGSSSQAASIEETSASLEEMASMTKRNAENAHKANELARQTRSAAEGGAANMDQMSAAMGAIKGSSDDIAKIIKTIDEIAFQTNILALNAAVEAARAGEAGMGFAVVADEVRALAQRSAKAAKETAEKIEGAISKTAQGVDISGKVAHALNDIVIKVRQVDELAAEVAGASREQTQGITQINTAVGQMDKVTQNNAAAAEESAAAAEELNGQAHVMKEAVAGLQQLCGLTATGMTVLSQSSERVQSPIVTSASTAQKRSANGHPNGNGAPNPENRKPAKPATAPAANHRSAIPMDGDFREF